MGKKGASRNFVNYAGRYGTVHSKTYQDTKYGQNQNKLTIGQREGSRERPASGLIKLTEKNKK